MIRHDFGPEAAAYLRSYFDKSVGFGKRLGKLLARHNIEAGVVSAFVPANTASDRLVDFENGGLFGSGVGRSAAEPLVRGWLAARLGIPSPTPRLLCAEDALMRRSDPVIERLSDHSLFFCGDDVYWYATGNNLEDPVLQAGASWRPDITMVTSLPGGLDRIQNRQSIDSHTLAQMAEDAVGIMVGAWDNEGFLLWEPADSVATPRSELRYSENATGAR